MHAVALMKALQASGWKCRAVIPSASGAWRLLVEADIKHAIRPSSDQGLDEWCRAGGPFDSWTPDVIHVCGDDLESAAAVYHSTAVPMVLSVDDDALTGVPRGDDAADLGKISLANQRVASFITSSRARHADLSKLFGEEHVVFAEGAAAFDVLSGSTAGKTTETAVAAEHAIAVFIEPHDSAQTAILLDALRLFQPDAGRRTRIQVIANSGLDDAAFVNALHWACKAIQIDEGVDVDVRMPDSPWHATLPCCDCVTYLGPPDPAPLEILAAGALGIWAISAAPCEYIETEGVQGEILRSFTGVALADAWHDRVRARATPAPGAGQRDMTECVAAMDQVYRSCLAAASAGIGH